MDGYGQGTTLTVYGNGGIALTPSARLRTGSGPSPAGRAEFLLGVFGGMGGRPSPPAPLPGGRGEFLLGGVLVGWVVDPHPRPLSPRERGAFVGGCFGGAYSIVVRPGVWYSQPGLPCRGPNYRISGGILANPEHIAIAKSGPNAVSRWREQTFFIPNDRLMVYSLSYSSGRPFRRGDF